MRLLREEALIAEIYTENRLNIISKPTLISEFD